MGSGSSQASFKEAVAQATEQDLGSFISALPREDRAKIDQALLAHETECKAKLPEVAEYEIEVDRTSGTTLGVLVEERDGMMVVSELGYGLIVEWNKHHQEQVSVGDQIVEVNGVRDDAQKFLGLCSQNIRLRIKLVRASQTSQTNTQQISERKPAVSPVPLHPASLKSDDEYDFYYKVVLVGEAATGKTHLLSRYIRGKLPKEPQPTIGVEYATRTVELEVGGTVKAQIWDTGGQERYRVITSAHYRRSVGALLVYDVTNHSTYANCKTWVEALRESAEPGIVITLVGNKVDLVESSACAREVPTEMAAEFARVNGLLFLEVSAVSAYNVINVFEGLLQEICNQHHGPRRILQLEKISGPDEHGVAELQCNDISGNKMFSSSFDLNSTPTSALSKQIELVTGLSACEFQLVCNGVPLSRKHKDVPLADLFASSETC